MVCSSVTFAWNPLVDKTASCHRTREISVRRKLNAMPAVFAGKNVLLVDDSIVRGTTMSQIVDMVLLNFQLC